MADGFRSVTPPPQEADVNSDNFYELYYRQLIGMQITAVGKNAEGFPYFVAKLDNVQYTLEISQDEEGNGPGFMFGLQNPYDRYKKD